MKKYFFSLMSLNFQSMLKHCIDLVTASIQNPLILESEDERRELVKFLGEMKKLFDKMRQVMLLLCTLIN